MRTIGTPSTQVRKLNAIASGTLPNGKPVVVNANGTVSAVALTGTSGSKGTAVVFETANIGPTSTVYDANAQKIVVVYEDDGNSSYGTAVVGTVSGTSISFGTPVVFDSVNCVIDRNAAVYDANAQKIVIAYRVISPQNGRAIVGTVSGTSISFGSATAFNSGESKEVSAVYDANSQKIAVAYNDGSNSDYGTAIVGTVSGTSISFGSDTVFESAATERIGIAYDANAQKVVIVYSDGGNSSYGTAIVGTISGTSISFGSVVVFESADSRSIITTYDASAQKILILYKDAGNSNDGTGIVGTVSGTSISFGSPTVFETSSASEISATYDTNAQKVVVSYKKYDGSYYGIYISATISGTSVSFDNRTTFLSGQADHNSSAYDSNAQKIVISYRDITNSNYGTAVVIQTDTISINLTSENYVGLSSNGYPNTAGATIDVKGAINNRQSGLTAGQSYFVQMDGTLGTTAGSPSVFAGTAVSATKIIVKG